MCAKAVAVAMRPCIEASVPLSEWSPCCEAWFPGRLMGSEGSGTSCERVIAVMRTVSFTLLLGEDDKSHPRPHKSSGSINLWSEFCTACDKLQTHCRHVFAKNRSADMFGEDISHIINTKDLHESKVFASEAVLGP